MNDETERIYKELLKQYAEAVKQANKDGGDEENIRRLQVTRNLAMDLLQLKYSKKRTLGLLDATAKVAKLVRFWIGVSGWGLTNAPAI